LATARAAIDNNVTLPTGLTVSTQTVGGTPYTIKRTVRWVGIAQSGSLCSSGSTTSSVSFQRVDASVTWPTMGGIPAVTSNTIVAPPAGTLSTNSITIPVLVQSAALAGESGMTVTATPTGGGSPQTAVTDSDGCAVFADMTPGTYTVALNTAGYVDTAGVTAHSETDGSTATGMTAVVSILYDQAATLSLGLVNQNGAAIGSSFPLPSTLQTVVTQTGSSAFPKTVTLTPASPTTTVNPVFPFNSTGGVYGATAYSTACSTSAASTTSGSPAPGGTASLSIPLDSVTGTFTNTAGTALSGYTITAITGTASGCTSEVYSTFGTSGTRLVTSGTGAASTEP
jgi:hypothetical protein